MVSKKEFQVALYAPNFEMAYIRPVEVAFPQWKRKLFDGWHMSTHQHEKALFELAGKSEENDISVSLYILKYADSPKVYDIHIENIKDKAREKITNFIMRAYGLPTIPSNEKSMVQLTAEQKIDGIVTFLKSNKYEFSRMRDILRQLEIRHCAEKFDKNPGGLDLDQA